jgi:hypothetical protein
MSQKAAELRVCVGDSLLVQPAAFEPQAGEGGSALGPQKLDAPRMCDSTEPPAEPPAEPPLLPSHVGMRKRYSDNSQEGEGVWASDPIEMAGPMVFDSAPPTSASPNPASHYAELNQQVRLRNIAQSNLFKGTSKSQLNSPA